MPRLPLVLSASTLALISAIGCGGGGASGITGTTGATGGGTTGGSTGGNASKTTARFYVDVRTGKVRIVPGVGTPTSKRNNKVFGGTSVLFNSGVLLDQPGNTGRKVLQVSLTNHSGETIGALPDGTPTGFNVLFSAITNGAGSGDLRASTSVSTLAGSVAGNLDGAAQNAEFRNPTGAAVSTDGTVYVVDRINNAVRSIAGGRVATVAGGGSGAADGVGRTASFSGPMGMAFNPADGALVVADLGNNRIRRVTPDGRVTTIAGTGVVGGANGAGSAANFSSPTSVAVSASGTIFVSEDGNRIRKIVLTSSTLDPRVAGNYTVSTYAGTGTAGAADGLNATASFNLPRGLALDLLGNLYVADYGNRKIRRISPTGEVTTIAGTGASSSIDGPGSSASFKSPNGLAIVNNALYVAEYGASEIRQVAPQIFNGSGTPGSWQVSTIAGSGALGATNGSGDVASFNGPFGIAADASGNLIVADLGNNEVRQVSPSSSGFPIGTDAGGISTDPVVLASPDGRIPVTDQPYLTYPNTLQQTQTSDSRDWVFIVPSGVTAFTFDVTVEASTPLFTSLDAVTNAGPAGGGSANNYVRPYVGGSGSDFADGNLSEARFNAGGIDFLCSDRQGNIYVPDGLNRCIRRVGIDGIVSTIAGISHLQGSADGPGDTASFSRPSGVAVAADGMTLFVADTGGNTVRRIALTGGDPHLPASWTVNTIAGSSSPGAGDGNGSSATFDSPEGVAISAGGVVYVTEFLGNRVRRLTNNGGDPTNPANWQVLNLAGDNSAAVGLAGSTDGRGTAVRFSGPSGVAVDTADNLYVCDFNNSTIRKIDSFGATTTVAGVAENSAYVDGPLGTNTLTHPSALTIDSAGYVFFADSRRIRRLSPGGNVATVAGDAGVGDTNGAGSTASFVGGVAGLAFDASGTLYALTGGTVGGVSDSGCQIKTVQRILNSGTTSKRFSSNK